MRKSPFIMQKTIPSHTWALKQILWSSAKHAKQYRACTFYNMFRAFDAKTSTTYVAMPMNHRFRGHPMYLDDISSTLSFLAALMNVQVWGYPTYLTGQTITWNMIGLHMNSQVSWTSHVLGWSCCRMEHHQCTHEFTRFVDISRTWDD